MNTTEALKLAHQIEMLEDGEAMELNSDYDVRRWGDEYRLRHGAREFTFQTAAGAVLWFGDRARDKPRGTLAQWRSGATPWPECPDHGQEIADGMAHCEVCDLIWLLQNDEAESPAVTASRLTRLLEAPSP